LKATKKRVFFYGCGNLTRFFMAGYLMAISDRRFCIRQHAEHIMSLFNVYWFYQKVRNGGPWDYKFDPYFAAFGNFNFGAAPQMQTSCLWALAGLKAVLAPQNLNGENGTKSRLTDTDQRNIREGIDYAIQNGY
jgi:hypothetical protein